MNNDCTVLVTSCDAYRDVEAPFLQLFRKYWPDCPFELVLVTETSPNNGSAVSDNGEAVSSPLVRKELRGPHSFDRTIFTGKGKTWSQMLVAALDQIETPYVIMLMNDYFLESSVDTENILRRLDEAKEKGALNYRLCPDPPRAVKNTAYSVSCKAGIWNRQFLRALAAKTKSAWEFERYGSFMFDESDQRPLLVTEKLEFPFQDVVHKGYWEPWGVELLKREGIAYDFSVRGLPPLSVRIKEKVKNFIFRLNPELVTRIQNIFNVGKH